MGPLNKCATLPSIRVMNPRGNRPCNLYLLYRLEKDFNYKNILTQSAIENHKTLIKNIKNNLDNHFKNQMRLPASRTGTITSSPATHFSADSNIYLNTLQQEIYRKLDETIQEVTQRSNTPNDEDIKRHLLSRLEEKLDEHDGSETWTDAEKKAAKTRKTIDILFSTSRWITAERRLESLKKVQSYFSNDDKWWPIPVSKRIFPKEESTNSSSASNPYVDINQ